MENEIYSKTVIPASESNDGCTRFVVTVENNGHAVWRIAPDGYEVIHFAWMFSRDDAISMAYERAKVEIAFGVLKHK